MEKTISTTETAKLIRKELKVAFPGIALPVRSEKYSGGSSITILCSGVDTAIVEKIVEPFKGYGPDTQDNDLWVRKNNPYEVRHIFVENLDYICEL